MRGWIIDDAGELWPEYSGELSKRLRSARVGQELTQVVVSLMGYAAVRDHGHRLDMLFDPATVAPRALCGLYQWSRENAFRPTSCWHPREPNLAKVFHAQDRLTRFILDVLERRAPRPAFTRQPAVVEHSSFRDRWSAALTICAAAKPAIGEIPELERLFSGYYVFAALRQDGEYEIRALGACHKKYDPAFAAAHVGKTFRETYDTAFGNWSADCFNEMRDTKTPTVEAIDALISFPNVPSKRYYYERLSLPLVRDGRKFLLVGVTPTA